MSERTVIKVKLYGRYRQAELLKRGRKTITVRVLSNEQSGGCPAYWDGVPITWVRKADRHLCTLPGVSQVRGQSDLPEPMQPVSIIKEV